MSKSYRKYPVVRQAKENRKHLNRQIRYDKYAEFSTPSAFKRHRPHWYSWHYRWTKEDAIESWRTRPVDSLFSTLDEWLEYWAKCALRK